MPKYNQATGDVKGKEGFFCERSGFERLEKLFSQHTCDLIGKLMPFNSEGRALMLEKNAHRVFVFKNRFGLVGTIIGQTNPGADIGGAATGLLNITSSTT